MFGFNTFLVFACFLVLTEVKYGAAAPPQEEEGRATAYLADLKARGCVFNNPDDPFFCCFDGDKCTSSFFKRTPETERIIAEWKLKHYPQSNKSDATSTA